MTDATDAGRLWGGRFQTGPDQAAFELGRSVDFDQRLWRQDLDGSVAHADQLAERGLLDPEEHRQIVAALEQIRAEFSDGRFEFSADDEDLHGAVERRLVELTGAVGGKLRAGRSRNDQIASDLRLYIRDACAELITAVEGLQRALADQAGQTLDWVTPGYTHLQRAQPVVLAHHLLAHAWALHRDVGRLHDAAGRASISTLGAGALAGATLGLDPAAYARALGFNQVAENSMDAVADRDFAVEFLAAAAMLGVHLSRLGEEIVLWASVEFGWARVGEAFSTGSSIMPQKRNPDVAELVRGKTGRLIGDLVALLVTLKGLPMTYNRDLQEDKEPVFDAVDTLRLAVPALAGTVRSLEFDRKRLANSAGGGHALATDLAEALVTQGVPFRAAHEQVGRAVAAAEELGVDVADLEPTQLRELLPNLPDGDLPGDATTAVHRRNASLGPAPEAVRDQLEALRAAIG